MSDLRTLKAVVDLPGHPADGKEVRIIRLYSEPQYSVRWDETESGYTTCALPVSALGVAVETPDRFGPGEHHSQESFRSETEPQISELNGHR